MTAPNDTLSSKCDSSTLVDHFIRDPVNNKMVQTEKQIVSVETNYPHITVDKNYPHLNVDKNHSHFTYESVKDNELALQRLTFVSREVFEFLLDLLPPSTVRYSELQNADRLLLTLMRLKTGISSNILCVFFNIHHTTANRIFHKTLTQIVVRTRDWITWPKKFENGEKVHACNYCSNCKVTVDCFEIKTVKPSTSEKQTSMWSEHKKSHTMKYLIGLTAGGIISFKSKGYGGSSTDEFIAADCGILSKSDKVFPLTVCEESAVIDMPTFVDSQKPQFRSQEVEDYAKFAVDRVHPERGINRLGVFNIFNNRIPFSLISVADNIFHVCCVLTNLKVLKNVDEAAHNE
ncbi:hypothetical protein CHUAL_014115 [Chamberlinius hualienensis]